MERLTDTERAALATTLPLWALTQDGAAIRRGFRFRDFNEAWGFMSRVALLAECHNHHPNWSNTWNRVEITLSTHEARGLTSRDLRLAQAIDALLA
jgi:4a-hydroxytetrahydrobiopterin dehydratase